MKKVDRRLVVEGGCVIGIHRNGGPRVDQFLHRRHLAGRQRRIGIDADRVELIPKPDMGGLVGRRRIGQFAVIDLADRRNEIGPVAAILRAGQTAHLVANREHLDISSLRDGGEMDDLGLVGS